MSALGPHWTSFSPSYYLQVYELTNKASSLHGQYVYTGKRQPASHSSYLSRRTIIINVWWAAKHMDLIYNVSLLWEGGLVKGTSMLENAYLPSFAKGPDAHLLFFPMTSTPVVVCCLIAWMALSTEQMEQFFPASS